MDFLTSIIIYVNSFRALRGGENLEIDLLFHESVEAGAGRLMETELLNGQQEHASRIFPTFKVRTVQAETSYLRKVISHY